MDHKELQENVNKVFVEAFVHTPLTKRLKDIDGECRELCNYTNISNLKEEAGDLLATLLQLCNESGWDIADLLKENENKIRRRMLQYKGRGRKTNVAILGGAFDPVTKSHIELAKFVLNVSKWADEVWLMPAYRHLDGKDMQDWNDRIKMLSIAVKEDARIKISTYEKDMNLHGETYHLLNNLTHDKEYDNYRFAFIIGQDRANTIEDWYNSDELLKMDVPFIVVPRANYERKIGVDWFLKVPHIYIEKEGDNIPNFSSTQFRENYKKGNFAKASKVVYEGVFNYIKANKIY